MGRSAVGGAPWLDRRPVKDLLGSPVAGCHVKALAATPNGQLDSAVDLSIRQIQSKIVGRVSRGIVGEVTKRARAVRLVAL